MFEESGDAELLDVMREAQRAQRIAVARGLVAVGRLAQRRLAAASGAHDGWCVDDWEAIAAEVGAELGISRGRASSQMHYGKTLLEELPTLAAVFLAGEVDFRVIAVIDMLATITVRPVGRGGHVFDPDRVDVVWKD